MISLQRLRDLMVGDWVVIDRRGDPIDMEVPPDVGPATLLVSQVTDALKRVDDGLVTASIERSEVWVVDAIVLNSVVLRHLGEGQVTTEELLERVRERGYAWQISPISVP